MTDLRCFVGCYTEGGPHPFSATGDGIVSFTINQETGKCSLPELAIATPNPSWLCVHPNSTLIAAVEEDMVAAGTINTFMIADDGALVAQQAVPAPGAATCHIDFITTNDNEDSTDQLAAASYMGGNSALYSLVDGQLQQRENIINYEGAGPNGARQQSPHAHQVVQSPDGRWLLVCDLGTDRIHIHDLENDGKLHDSIVTPAGSGPRHLVWTDHGMWCWCELLPLLLEISFIGDSGSGTVSKSYDLSEFVLGIGSGGGIVAHDNLIAVAERETNSVLVFEIAAGEKPVLLSTIPGPGACPRALQFTPNGKFLLIASQDEHKISIHRCVDNGIDKEAVAVVETPSPTCMAFVSS